MSDLTRGENYVSGASGLPWTSLLMPGLLIATLLYIFTRKSKFASMIDALPGPKPNLPLIGNGLKLMIVPHDGSPQHFLLSNQPYGETLKQLHEELFRSICDLLKGFVNEPLIRFWIADRAYVAVTHAESIEAVLTSSKHITKSEDYHLLHDWLGFGLLTSTGDRWRSHRKLLTPTFHFKILDDFLVIFNEQAKILLSKLEVKASRGKFNVYPFITHAALDMICESAMGKSVNAQNKSDSEYVRAVYDIGEILLRRTVKPWLRPSWFYHLTSTAAQERKCLQILHGMTNQVIREKRTLLKNQNQLKGNPDEEVFGQKKRLAFLDLLIDINENGKGWSDEEIRQEVDTFMFEGHDTTAAAMNWSLLLVGQHPEVQKKIQDELNDIFGDDLERPVTTADLANMKYLDAVIKESLRLYPSVPFYFRRLEEQATILGKPIPAGATIAIISYIAHRNPSVFPDPEKFNPERFLGDSAVGRHPYAYVPFSAGPRNCIGQKFAIMEEKVVLSSIFRTFNVKSYDDREKIKLLAEPILRPGQGIHVTLEKRF